MGQARGEHEIDNLVDWGILNILNHLEQVKGGFDLFVCMQQFAR